MNKSQAIKKLCEAIRLKHMAYSTERTYAHWAGRYCDHIAGSPKGTPSRTQIESFISGLAKDASASTQNQAFNAIIFLYKHVLHLDPGEINALRAKRGTRIIAVPTQAQMTDLLMLVEDVHQYPTRLIVHLLYGCGLRVNEPLNLRVKDVDLVRGRLEIRDGKGNKDRVVAIPKPLADPVKRQIDLAACLWDRDRRNGIPVPLPHRLSHKYPSACYALPWYWVFPAHKPCRHPRTGETVRWRCHESNIQRAVRKAARAIGATSLITPHILRHAYATHAIERGANVRDVQAAMGHKHLDTTMRYITPDAMRVASPIEGAPANPPTAQSPAKVRSVS